MPTAPAASKPATTAYKRCGWYTDEARDSRKSRAHPTYSSSPSRIRNARAAHSPDQDPGIQEARGCSAPHSGYPTDRHGHGSTLEPRPHGKNEPDRTRNLVAYWSRTPRFRENALSTAMLPGCIRCESCRSNAARGARRKTTTHPAVASRPPGALLVERASEIFSRRCACTRG